MTDSMIKIMTDNSVLKILYNKIRQRRKLVVENSVKGDILPSNIVLFPAPTADSKEILTYSDKYNISNIYHYI